MMDDERKRQTVRTNFKASHCLRHWQEKNCGIGLGWFVFMVVFKKLCQKENNYFCKSPEAEWSNAGEQLHKE